MIGHLLKEPSAVIAFGYAREWPDRDKAFPVSLSLPLPLREEAWRGEPVAAVFENLLRTR